MYPVSMARWAAQVASQLEPVTVVRIPLFTWVVRTGVPGKRSMPVSLEDGDEFIAYSGMIVSNRSRST